MPTALDNGQRSPRKLLHAIVARLLGRKARASTADVSRKTYAIEDSGPYDEDEAREKIRAYCDEHGFFAAATLTVVEMSEDGGTSGRRVNAGRSLEGHRPQPLAYALSRRRRGPNR